MERGVPSTYPSQVDVANHRRERLRQLREERSRDSPLLKLPGELRNKIYEYVIEPGEVTLVLSKRPGGIQLDLSDSTKWRRSRRTSLGLTQVCRKIRAELLPLHHKAYMINTKLRYNSSVGELDAAALKIHDKAKGSATHNVVSWPFLLDILALVCQNKEVNIVYGSYVPLSNPTRSSLVVQPIRETTSQFVDAIIKASKRTRGAWFMRTKVQSMIFTMHMGSRPRLAIVVRPQEREVWMPYHGSAVAQAADVAVKEWLEKAGLGSIGLKLGNFDIA